jgi:hypothetical protein
VAEVQRLDWVDDDLVVLDWRRGGCSGMEWSLEAVQDSFYDEHVWICVEHECHAMGDLFLISHPCMSRHTLQYCWFRPLVQVGAGEKFAYLVYVYVYS